MEEMHLVRQPKFWLKKPKVKFDGKYFRRRMREVRRTLPKGLQ